MKKFITWLTRPKFTIFLKSGNVVHSRYYPIFEDGIQNNVMQLKKQKNIFDLARKKNIEMISRRKWYQPWA